MSAKIKLAIFDWDGTLTDSSAAIVSVVNATALAQGLPCVSLAAIRVTIGLGIRESTVQLYPHLDECQVEQFIRQFRSLANAHTMSVPALFPGVVETLQALEAQDFLLAVATGTGRQGLDRDLRALKVGHFFAVTRTADETRSKPNPQMLEEILAFTGVSAPEAVLIGDTTYDMQMAEHAGMPAVAVSYGVHCVAKLAPCQPLALIDTLQELPSVLAKHNS